jgi:HD superfamily phosphodiesterase
MVLMLLSEQIVSSEKKFRSLLEEFFREVYDSSFLPSHGIGHHQRVWQYAGEILAHLNDHGFEPDHNLTDKLIISCFLHDSGMAVERGTRHGSEGRKICERFLAENNLSVSVYEDVLETIENHDNKDYTSLYHPADLMTILSVADDLDAFGFIGIYRYMEKYIARNIPMKDLGLLITENSETRFENFIRTYSFSSTLLEKHTVRVSTIRSFFNAYNQQALYYKFDNQLTAGHCGVAEIIREMMKSNGSEQQIINYSKDFPDPVVQWFFSELEHELSEFR